MSKEIKQIDKQLLRDTTFLVIGKDDIKKEICNLIDKKFKFLEKNLKKANDAMWKLKNEQKKG